MAPSPKTGSSVTVSGFSVQGSGLPSQSFHLGVQGLQHRAKNTGAKSSEIRYRIRTSQECKDSPDTPRPDARKAKYILLR